MNGSLLDTVSEAPRALTVAVAALAVSAALLLPAPATGATYEFKLYGMDCEACEPKAVELFEGVDGIVNPVVSFAESGGTFEGPDAINRDALKQALATGGYELLFPGEKLILPLTEEERKGLDIQIVSVGEKVDLEKYMPEGRITIVDYYADWCKPCKILTPKIERLLLEDERLVLRKIDLVDWKSDASKQATKDFQISGLPFVRVFGPDGALLGEVKGNYIDKVRAVIARADAKGEKS
ncbi:MAG: hypothetical protein HKN20_00720 [Gemmatimonadetes bacterium]|nr:hypothetical protein [Gemmatimonadota bacterium]